MKVKHTIVAAEGLSSRQREKIAKQSTDPKELLRMAYDNSAAVRKTVANNDNAPESARRVLADDLDWYVRKAVAGHTTDSDILAKLADDEYWEVREAVAGRADDPDILAKLADDKYEYVRKAVAEHTDDPDILAKLADDKYWRVREAAAKRIGSVREGEPVKLVRPAKPTRTDWSIPIYSITNYSEIEDEIDKVVNDAANAYAKQYLGGTADVNVPHGAYDNDLDITITFHTPDGDEVKTVSAADILGPATARNKKKDCVKLLLNWMTKSL